MVWQSKKRVKETSTAMYMTQPGFQLHFAVLEKVVNLLNVKDLVGRRSVRIIEIGSGFGLLARVLLSHLIQVFPSIEFKYTGIEVDPSRIVAARATLAKFKNVELHNLDFFQDNFSFDDKSDCKILLSTGLIQSLRYSEMRALLCLRNIMNHYVGVISFPYVAKDQGDENIPIGNNGTKEFSFLHTSKSLESISTEFSFTNTGYELVLSDSCLQMLYSFESNGES